MASISQLTARLVDLFGSPVTANPAKLLGNLGVSPAGNVLVGTSTDDASNKLQVIGNQKVNGNLAVNGAFNQVTTGTTAALFSQSGPAGQYKGTYYQTGANFRWLTGSDQTAESGSNAGSNYAINRYTDAGAWIDSPIYITRSNGVVTQNQTNFTGNISTTGSVTGVNVYCGTGGVFYAQTNNSVGATGALHMVNDIGSGWGGWSTTATSVVQCDAPNAAAAYFGMRWTDWGYRHFACIAGYQGGTTSSTAMIAFLLSSSASPQFMFNDTGNATFSGTLTQSSDYRIKTNVQTVDPKDALHGVLALRPVTYDRTDDIADPDESHIGFIAHEIQEVFPVLVKGDKDAVKTVEDLDGDKTPYKPGTEPDGWVAPVKVDRVVPDLQSVNYIGMVPYLVASIQELHRELAELREEIASMKGTQ